MAQNQKPTEMQKAAVRAYMTNGGHKVNAYKTAGYSCNGNATTIAKRAHELFEKPLVKQYLVECQARVEEEFKITAVQKKRWLKQVIEAGLTSHVTEEGDLRGITDGNAVIRAVAELNKMDGDLAAQKHEVSATVTQAERVKALKAKREGSDYGLRADSADSA